MTAIGYRLSAVGCRLSAVRWRLAAVGYRLAAIRCPLAAGCIPESRVAPAVPGFYGLSAFQRGAAATVISSGEFVRRFSRGVLFCPLHRGKSGAARIGGGERSEPISRMVILPYDTES